MGTRPKAPGEEGAPVRRPEGRRRASRRARSRRAGERERGASLVEFAIVTNLFLLLVFGIIEFGIAYNDYISVRQGNREAARLGVVNDLDNAPPCKINGTTVTPPANPATKTDATNALVCKAKDRVGLDESMTKVKVEITGEAVGENLKVCVKFPLSEITGLIAPFIGGKTLQSAVTMRLEQVPEYQTFTETGSSC